MATNSENAVWNARYQGKRVPKNDVNGSTGAPFSLLSDVAAWADGSVNKAVKETHEANGGTFDTENQSDVDNGICDIFTLNKYVRIEMLYGQLGTSRGFVPGDTMSYRCYPTLILNANTVEKDYENNELFNVTDNPFNTDGTVNTGVSGGKYTTIVAKPALKFALPYDYIIKLTARLSNLGAIPDQVLYVKYLADDKNPHSFSTSLGGTYTPVNADGMLRFSFDVSAIYITPSMALPVSQTTGYYPSAYSVSANANFDFLFEDPNGDPIYNDYIPANDYFALSERSWYPTVGTFMLVNLEQINDQTVRVTMHYDNDPLSQEENVKTAYGNPNIDYNNQTDKPTIRNNTEYDDDGTFQATVFMFDNTQPFRYGYNLLSDSQRANYITDIGDASGRVQYLDIGNDNVLGGSFDANATIVNYNPGTPLQFDVSVSQGNFPQGTWEIGGVVKYKSLPLGIAGEDSYYSEYANQGTNPPANSSPNRISFTNTIDTVDGGSGTGSGGGGDRGEQIP